VATLRVSRESVELLLNALHLVKHCTQLGVVQLEPDVVVLQGKHSEERMDKWVRSKEDSKG